MKKDPKGSSPRKTDWRGLFLLTQLGFSVLVPPVLCLWAANWLQRRFSLGAWVWAPALILGLGAAFSSARSLIQPLLKPRPSDEDDDARR